MDRPKPILVISVPLNLGAEAAIKMKQELSEEIKGYYILVVWGVKVKQGVEVLNGSNLSFSLIIASIKRFFKRSR